MPVFAIVATTNPPAVKEAVQTQYGANHHEFAPNIWFVSDAGNTKTVADKIGITNGVVGSQGVVLQMSAYAGFAQQTAWTFLSQFPEARPNG